MFQQQSIVESTFNLKHDIFSKMVSDGLNLAKNMQNVFDKFFTNTTEDEFTKMQDSIKNSMAKNKGTRILITLECLECRSNTNKRSAGVSRYLTQKNRRNTPERIELRKYCPHCNKPTVHKEIK